MALNTYPTVDSGILDCFRTERQTCCCKYTSEPVDRFSHFASHFDKVPQVFDVCGTLSNLLFCLDVMERKGRFSASINTTFFIRAFRQVSVSQKKL